MKKVLLVFIVALVCSTTAMAVDIAISTQAGWFGQAAADAEMQEIADNVTGASVEQFTANDQDALADWVEAHTGDGASDLLILCGQFPDTIYAPGNTQADDSLAELFLDDGNAIINTGDWTFYVVNGGGTNGPAGLQTMMDIPGVTVEGGDDTPVTVTAEGQNITPSLADFATDRPFHLDTLDENWYPELVLAQNADGTLADPVIVRNSVTGGRVGIFYQTASQDGDPRGEVISEWINNWYLKNVDNPAVALRPDPANGVVDVPRDVVLGWAAGEYPGTHDVYLGTSFDDVNDADRANPMGVLLSQGQSDTMLDAGRLEFGQTYYWRVDEVNSVGSAIFQGDIWSFTVEPLAYPVANVIATSNAVSDEGSGPENTVNGSGLNELDQHSIEAMDMWLCSAGDEPVSLQYEFDGVYKLHEMQVWNYNVQFELMLGFGVKDVTVEYSENGTDWTVLEETVFAQGTAMADYAANTVVDFGGVAAQYVKLTVNSGYGPLPQYGLSEVRFLYIPASAREPQPADGATNVSVASDLNWRSGREAASHDVYMGTDPNALTLAGSVDSASFDPDALTLETSYYWQVTEVNEAEAISAWAGSVWSFSTQAYVVVEDFESYDDEENRIYETWADGWVNDTGATVGYFEAPFAETTTVKSGNQAMPLFYDNSSASVSETDLDLSQNWTVSGIKSLSLNFHGDADNTGQLYVKINGTKVAYDGPAGDIAITAWLPWNIDLSSVGGNLSNVKTLTIGIEGSGASGVLYLDDIRLYPKTPEYITPVEPDQTGIVAMYSFDGNANDSSGNGNHGTLNGDPQFVAGYAGSALDCDGVNDFVSTDKTASDLGIAGNSPRTVTCWVYTRGFANGGIYDVGNRDATQDFCLRTYDGVENRWRVQYWGGDYDFSYNTANKWVHFAHVHDGTRTQIYADGILIVDWEKTIDTTDDNPFQMGRYGWPDAYFNGLIDEVCVYNRALSGGEVLGLLGETTPRHKPF